MFCSIKCGVVQTGYPQSGYFVIHSVYIKATAVELSDPMEIKVAHRLLSNRHIVPYWKIEQLQENAPIRLYKAVPEKIWVNRESEVDGNYIDIRVEIDLLKSHRH